MQDNNTDNNVPEADNNDGLTAEQLAETILFPEITDEDLSLIATYIAGLGQWDKLDSAIKLMKKEQKRTVSKDERERIGYLIKAFKDLRTGYEMWQKEMNKLNALLDPGTLCTYAACCDDKNDEQVLDLIERYECENEFFNSIKQAEKHIKHSLYYKDKPGITERLEKLKNELSERKEKKTRDDRLTRMLGA